jgi:multidrug efflux pump subunit AcrB
MIGLAAFFLSLGLIPRLGFSLFPENDGPYFLVDVETPQGASVGETDRAVRFVESVLARHPEVEWVFANSGRGNPQIYYNEIPPEQLSNVGQVYGRFHEWRRDEGSRLIEAIRAELSEYAGARINLRRFTNGPPIEAPIAVRIRGPDLAALREIAAEVERIVRETPGARDVSNPMAETLIDLDLNIDDNAAALRGVQAGAIDQSLRIAVAGLPAAAFRDPAGDAYPVVVRAPRDGPMQVAALDTLYVWNGEGGATPLSELSRPQLESGPASIDRVQRERTATVRAYTESGFLISAVTGEVAQRLNAWRLPPG